MTDQVIAVRSATVTPTGDSPSTDRTSRHGTIRRRFPEDRELRAALRLARWPGIGHHCGLGATHDGGEDEWRQSMGAGWLLTRSLTGTGDYKHGSTGSGRGHGVAIKGSSSGKHSVTVGAIDRGGVGVQFIGLPGPSGAGTPSRRGLPGPCVAAFLCSR